MQETAPQETQIDIPGNLTEQHVLRLPLLVAEQAGIRSFDESDIRQITPSRAVFEPWDKEVDRELREEAFSCIVKTFRRTSYVRNVVGRFRKHDSTGRLTTSGSIHKKQANAYDRICPSDELVFFDFMEQGLHRYLRAVDTANSSLAATAHTFQEQVERLSDQDKVIYANLVIGHDIVLFSSLGLVGYLAAMASYSKDGRIEAADYYQAGVVGLIQGIRRHDSTNGQEFNPYWDIKGAMRQLNAEKGQRIGLPPHKFWQWNTIQQSVERLRRKTPAEAPTVENIAKDTDLSAAAIRELIAIRGIEPTSLNSLIGPDAATEVGELLPDETVWVEGTVIENDRYAALNAVLAEGILHDDEKFILGLRYGFSDEPGGLALSWSRNDQVSSYQAIASEFLIDRPDGLSVEEISRALGLPATQIKTIIERASRLIAMRLQPDL